MGLCKLLTGETHEGQQMLTHAQKSLGSLKKASPVERKISKVKFDHKQSTVASLSHRKHSSSIPVAESQKPAAEIQVTGAHGRDCTQVQPTYKTGYESRINLMYRSTTSFEEALSQLVTGTGTTTTVRMENRFPRGH